MPLFVSEINFAAVTLTENVGVIFCSQNRIRRITLVKYTKIICISTFAFLQAKHRIPTPLRAVFSVLCAFPSKGQRRSRWRKPSLNFWSVNCRGNGAGTAANLLFSESKYETLDG